MILGTAGHIDHGKTALVRALTGVDTDRLPEEKRRGITIDLGFAPLVLDDGLAMGVVDVPGHEAFVRTMVAGASGIDLAMLVVAADEGVMPQTREHLEILSLLGIRHGVVAITKSDLVDADWLTLVEEDVRRLVGGSFLHEAPVLPVSAVTGSGLSELKSALAGLARLQPQARGGDVFRMPIDRAFSVKGTGTVVTGTVWSGSIAVDESVFLAPAQKKVRIRGLETHGRKVNRISAGSRAAVALAGCEVGEVARGMALVDRSDWKPTRELLVSLDIRQGRAQHRGETSFRVHIATAETEGKLRSVQRVPGKDAVVARLVLDNAVIARGGDRLILRLPSPIRTIGGGEVLDPVPPAARKEAGLALALASADGGERLNILVDAAGHAGVEIPSLSIRTQLAPGAVDGALVPPGIVRIEGRALSAEHFQTLLAKVDAFVATSIHNPAVEEGVSVQTLRASFRLPEPVIDAAIARLIEEGRLERAGGLVRPSGWEAMLDSADRDASDALMQEICTRPLEPPSVPELERQFGRSTGRLLRRLERDGVLERLSEERYYSREAVGAMIGRMQSALEPGRLYTPAELKEVLGVTRKYLIPLLEFCDRRGITERREAGRLLR